jgi:hypothetical protein
MNTQTHWEKIYTEKAPNAVSWVRYDAEWLHREFGVHFRSLGRSKELHQTPFGPTQQFLFVTAESIVPNQISEMRPFTDLAQALFHPAARFYDRAVHEVR